MVYKSSFSLMIYAMLVVLAVAHHRNNHLPREWLDISNSEWENIQWRQGAHILYWQNLPLQGGIWVLNIGKTGLAMQVDQQVFKNVLTRLTKRTPLELVSYQYLDDTALIPFGLSEDLRTVITLESGQRRVVLVVGNRTPGGREVYILRNNHVFKTPLDFIFQLPETAKQEGSEKEKTL